MMRLIIPFVFALVGAVALAATHAFEDDKATHGTAFMALLAASHAAATAQAGGAPPAIPAATRTQPGGVVAAMPQRSPAR